MPLGWVAAGTAIAGLGLTAANDFGAFGSPSGGQVSSTQLQEQQTIFGEQQGFEKQLSDLINNPSSVTSLPGYQFNLSQGEGSLARQFQAAGYGGSGNEGAGLMKYGQDYAMSTYNQQIGILSQLAGISAQSSPGQLGSGAIAGQANQNQQFNNLLYQLGIVGGGARGSFGAAGSPGGVGGGGSSIWDTNSGTPWYLNPWNSGGTPNVGGGAIVNTGPGAAGG